MGNKEMVIDGCMLYVENGEVKTVFSEEIQKKGYMPLETAMRLSVARVNLFATIVKDGK